MEKEILPLRPLEIEQLENDLSMMGVAFFAFTKDARKYIKQRDGGCVFPETDHEGATNVHHLVPKSLADKSGIDVDHPLNGALICNKHHERLHFPAEDHKCSFDTERGCVVWNDTWDEQLAGTVIKNTRKAIVRGLKYPKD